MVLQAIRERLSGIIAIFIFGILIIPFIFVGVDSYFTADAVNSVARVNDVEISTTEFTEGFQNYRRRMQQLMGESFDAEQFDQPIIRRQYLDSMIDRELLAQLAVQSGFEVDDDTLAQAIKELPGFQVDGEFNADVYQQRLISQGRTPQQFENDMRAQLMLDQVPDSITSSAIATDWELERYVRLQDQKRAFQAILVPAQPSPGAEGTVGGDDAGSDSAAVVEGEAEAEPDTAAAATEGAAEADTEDPGIADADILAWYESHPELYRSEEQVTIEYLELNAADMNDDTVPEEDILRARFEEQKARFVTPESRLASHILIEVDPEADDGVVESARQQAEDLAKRAQAGEDFAALAEEFSQDTGSAASGGDLGWVEPGFMVQAFEDALYALSPSSPISEPVQTGFGWHVIQLRDVRPAAGMSFEEARETLLTEYTAEVQERNFLEQADRLVDLIYEDPTTLENGADELGLEVKVAGPFGRSGGAEGVAANPAVVKAAFSDLVLVQGTASDPIDLGENHMVIVRVREHTPEGSRPLEEVRESVIAAIGNERATVEASRRADTILAQLESGADISAVAEAEKLELVAAEAATRAGTELAPDLVSEVFLLKAPEADQARHAIVKLGNGFAVVRLEGVVDGQVTEGEELRLQNYRRRIANATASDELTGFVRMLREQSDIQVYEDRL